MRPSSEASVIELSRVSCSHPASDGRVGEAVREICVAFPPRSFNLVTGAFPGERALLLRLLSLQDAPESGDVLFEGASTRGLDETTRADLRARRLGLIYASPFLLPSLSAIENIAVPLFKIAHLEPAAVRERAEAVLDFVGLSGSEQARCGDLNRYEQHCLTLARALAAEPAVLLVEEIDSTLGSDALPHFAALLRHSIDRYGVTVIATASPAYAAGAACRVVDVGNGATDSVLLREPLA